MITSQILASKVSKEVSRSFVRVKHVEYFLEAYKDHVICNSAVQLFAFLCTRSKKPERLSSLMESPSVICNIFLHEKTTLQRK